MRGLNKVQLIGNLGADPEVRYMPDGNAVANISVATAEEWKDKNTGEKRQRVDWHRVVIFGKLGEIAGQYLRKGAKVYIEGQLRTRKWQGHDGSDRYTTEVQVSFSGTMIMLGGGGQNGQVQPHATGSHQARQRSGGRSADARAYQQASGAMQAPPDQVSSPGPQDGGPTGFDDDIPF